MYVIVYAVHDGVTKTEIRYGRGKMEREKEASLFCGRVERHELRGSRDEDGAGIWDPSQGIGTRMSPTGEDEGEGGQCTRVEESLVLETRTRTRTGPKGQR